MRDLNRLCMGCMKEKPEIGECPHCHFSLEKYEIPKYHLEPQTILAGKYLVGKVIGETGFEIIYIGWDLNREIPLVIKEYFPSGYAVRNHSMKDSIIVLNGERERYYKIGKENFLKKAKNSTKFYGQEGIISARDYFQANETAYIVMDRIEERTFGRVLRERGCAFYFVEEIFEMMRPIVKSLDVIHKEGIICSNINPNDIVITQEGTARLAIDFGTAIRLSDGESGFSVLLNKGYSPVEQYQVRGNLGPWTDVYALCATIYWAITGREAPASMERLMEDGIKKPSELGIQIATRLEEALMKGLAILAQDRWQSMGELYEAFYGEKIEKNKRI